MGRWLHALGSFCSRRHWVVLGVWLLVIGAVVAAVRVFGAETSNDLQLPGTGSQQVQDLLTAKFPPQQNGTNPIVFHVQHGKLTDKKSSQAVKESVRALRKTPHVYSVTNPVSNDGQTAGLLSHDARTAFAPVLLDIGSGELDAPIAQRIIDATRPAQHQGIEVEAAGSVGSELSKEPTESSELVGILAAMFILTLVLGSLVAMGLPIVTAVLGLAIGLGIVGLLGHVLSIPGTGATLATMIGLGVGIDYALFLISRHLDQLRGGMPVVESVAGAVAGSGGAILFAGGTVVAALVSLRVAGIPLLSTLGLASAVAVVTAVLAALTLLPALLGLLERRILWLSLPWARRSGTGKRRSPWVAWAAFVARRPFVVGLAALAVLAPLMIPALSLQFGQEDIGAASKSTTERKAYDLLTAGFGVGYNGPLQVASSLDPVATPSNEYTTKDDKAHSLKKELKRKQKQLPKQQKKLEAQQKSLKAQQKQLEAEQQQLLDQQSSLEQQKTALQEEQASLEQQGTALQQRGDQLKVQQAALEQQKRQLESRKAALQADRNRLERQAASLQHRIHALAARIRPLARQLARILAGEHLLERRIAKLGDDHPVRKAVLEAALAALQVRDREVRASLAPLEQQARVLAAQARALEARKARLQQQADSLQQQADALQARATHLRAEGAQLQQQQAELQRRAAALQAEAATLQQQADQLTQRGHTLQADANALQAQGAQLQQQADHLKHEQKTAKQQQKQAEQLKKQLTAMLTKAGGDPRNTDPRVVRLQDALSRTSGVAGLLPPQTNKKGDVVLLSAVPTTAPASQATTRLLSRVRTDVVPGVEKQGGITSYVGGYTASYVDLATLISARLLLVIGTVVMLGFILLTVAFRSLLVPLQAAVTNVLSAAAAFGILTATFQWGWGVSMVGIETASSGVPIASYVPLMMFAVLFGLSMDYEVFLVSHVQQHHLGGEPARQAAASGLASSGRITTAACLIMTAVFASFVLNGDPTIKQFGVGLASAVLLAGILVVTLAPAAIVVMGEAAWWLPRWLSRLLPHLQLEAAEPSPAAASQAPAPVGAGLLPAQRTTEETEPTVEEPAARSERE